MFILDRDERLRVYRNLGIRETGIRTLATNLKIASELDAEYVVFGTFQVEEFDVVHESRVTLAITVMDVGKWRKLGEVRVEGKLLDLGNLETRAAYLVLRALQPGETEEESTFLEQYPPVRLDARESYVRGLIADAEDARHRYFTQAVRLEESYSAPAFRLAELYWQKRNYRQAAVWLRKLGGEMSHRREVLFMLGVCEARLGRYAEAEVQLRALYASAPLPEVANNLAVVLSRQNREGVLELLSYAVDREPEDPDYRFNLGHALWLRERYDDAVERFREVLDLVDEDEEATRMLGRSLQREISRPARAAVENLNRLKEDFNDLALAVAGAGQAGAPQLDSDPPAEAAAADSVPD